MGRTPHQSGKPQGLFGRGPAVRSENVAITGEESLLSKGAVPFSFLWGVRPISPESPKGFSGVALPTGEKTLPFGGKLVIFSEQH